MCVFWSSTIQIAILFSGASYKSKHLQERDGLRFLCERTSAIRHLVLRSTCPIRSVHVVTSSPSYCTVRYVSSSGPQNATNILNSPHLKPCAASRGWRTLYCGTVRISPLVFSLELIRLIFRYDVHHSCHPVRASDCLHSLTSFIQLNFVH